MFETSTSIVRKTLSMKNRRNVLGADCRVHRTVFFNRQHHDTGLHPVLSDQCHGHDLRNYNVVSTIRRISLASMPRYGCGGD